MAELLDEIEFDTEVDTTFGRRQTPRRKEPPKEWGGQDIEITTTVTRIVFEKNDFVIADTMDGVSVKGNAPAGEIKEGLAYRFHGKPTIHPQYGPQLAFTSFSIYFPHDEAGVVAFLSKVATGIGITTARKFWKEFGPAAVDTLADNPDEVVRRGLLSQKVAEAASKCVAAVGKMRQTRIDMAAIFDGSGFPKATSEKAIELWGVDAPRRIRKNPFELLFAGVIGCGFKRCDELHHRLKLPPDSPSRVIACVWNEVSTRTSGHTWTSASDVEAAIFSLIGTSKPSQAVREAINRKLVTVHMDREGKQWLTEPHKDAAERKLAASLVRLGERPPDIWPELKFLTALSQHQRDKAVGLLAGRVAILRGSPGVGKTYAAAEIIRQTVSGMNKHDVAVCAPTGKAAVRITRAMKDYNLGMQAVTIHRLLGIRFGSNGKWEFTYNRENPLPYKLVVTDEVSMADTELLASLLDAMPNDGHLLLVGDPYQLPPVGHGAPMRDLLGTNVAVAELTEIHRNSGLIVQACRDIKDSKPFQTCESFGDEQSGDNFRFAEAADGKEAAEYIRQVATRLAQKRTADPTQLDPIEDVQVLTVINDGSPLSRSVLNVMLQNVLNPNGHGYPGRHPFRVGDKVICLKNGVLRDAKLLSGFPETDFSGWTLERGLGTRYIANGDMGIVLSVTPDAAIIRWRHPDRVVALTIPLRDKSETDPTSIGGVALGYAVTTHKSQGSSWPFVIVAVDDSSRSRNVACRELLYTAISRAEKRCLLVGRRKTADSWCQTVTMRNRKTFLKERLLEAAAKRKELMTGDSMPDMPPSQSDGDVSDVFATEPFDQEPGSESENGIWDRL